MRNISNVPSIHHVLGGFSVPLRYSDGLIKVVPGLQSGLNLSLSLPLSRQSYITKYQHSLKYVLN